VKAVRWSARVVGGVAVLVALAYGIGMLLPVGHRVSVERKVIGSAEEVWRTIAGVEGPVAWRSDLKRVEILEEEAGRSLWRECSGQEPMTFELVETRRAGTRSLDDLEAHMAERVGTGAEARRGRS